MRVGNSRVSLDVVVREFQNGLTPEDIVSAYDSLSLSDVYSVLAYYLRRPDEVTAYLQQRDEDATALRKTIEAQRPPLSRQALLARRRAQETGDAALGK